MVRQRTELLIIFVIDREQLELHEGQYLNSRWCFCELRPQWDYSGVQKTWCLDAVLSSMARSLRVARLTIDEFLASTVAVIAARVVIFMKEWDIPLRLGCVHHGISILYSNWVNVPSPVGGGRWGGGTNMAPWGEKSFTSWECYASVNCAHKHRIVFIDEFGWQEYPIKQFLHFRRYVICPTINFFYRERKTYT